MIIHHFCKFHLLFANFNAVINFYSKRLVAEKSQPRMDNPKETSLVLFAKPSESKISRKRKRFDLFGPRLGDISLLSGNSGERTAKDKARSDLTRYSQYHKGYVMSGLPTEAENNDLFNENLKAKYDANPRTFWCKDVHTLIMGDSLVSFANYIFSKLAQKIALYS